ncbi:MAG: metal-sulfur cluster assembly factor [Deltaproteobacteria bacterium]|nr:metal-sulfur cluster assembly factor [Deltaproteobacteria bacterium]
MNELTYDIIIERLKTIVDPELKLDIVFLGLIRDVQISDKVIVKMTLTSPACPYASTLIEEVKSKLTHISGAKEVSVELVLSPPWEPPDHVKDLFGWD